MPLFTTRPFAYPYSANGPIRLTRSENYLPGTHWRSPLRQVHHFLHHAVGKFVVRSQVMAVLSSHCGKSYPVSNLDGELLQSNLVVPPVAVVVGDVVVLDFHHSIGKPVGGTSRLRAELLSDLMNQHLLNESKITTSEKKPSRRRPYQEARSAKSARSCRGNLL